MNAEITGTSIPRQCPAYRLDAGADTYVLVNAEGAGEYGLNAMAAAIWGLCSGAYSIDEITAIVAERYPESTPAIRRDVFSTIQSFRHARTVYCSDIDATDVSLPSGFHGARVYSADPVVAAFDDFLSAAECRHLIAAAEPGLERARVAQDCRQTISAHRTNSLVKLDFAQDPILEAIGQRAADLVGLPLAHCEAPQVLSYGVGEEYKAHGDGFDLDTDNGRFFTTNGGQRLSTLLIYLNTVEAGGDTSFPCLDITARPRQGRALLFHNCYPGTVVPDPRALHQAHAVVRGGKWAMPLWIRERGVS